MHALQCRIGNCVASASPHAHAAPLECDAAPAHRRRAIGVCCARRARSTRSRPRSRTPIRSAGSTAARSLSPPGPQLFEIAHELTRDQEIQGIKGAGDGSGQRRCRCAGKSGGQHYCARRPQSDDTHQRHIACHGPVDQVLAVDPHRGERPRYAALAKLLSDSPVPLAPLRHRHREARCQQFSGLARQLLIKHHSAVGLVDRLVDQGYLVRKPSREDGRKVELRLTAKGTRVLGRLADMRRHELVHASPELTALLAQITHPTEAGAGA